MTEYDIDNLAQILAGEGTWFTAKLLRLISGADKQNREELFKVYPKEVSIVHHYQTGEWFNDCVVLLPDLAKN